MVRGLRQAKASCECRYNPENKRASHNNAVFVYNSDDENGEAPDGRDDQTQDDRDSKAANVDDLAVAAVAKPV